MSGALYEMMKDRYGNYVIQKCIEVSKGKQTEILVKKISACANMLRKQANYSRHVYNFIEKLNGDGINIPLLPNDGPDDQSVNNYAQHSSSGTGGGSNNNYNNSNQHN